MSRWDHAFHIVWATKRRQPSLTPAKEEAVFCTVMQIVESLGYETLAVNGMPDHIHLLLGTGPKVDLSVLMKQIKGTSSALLNDMTKHDQNFRWQEGYYSATVTPSHLAKVLAYIKNQKQHHAEGTTHPYWEETGETEDGSEWERQKKEQSST